MRQVRVCLYGRWVVGWTFGNTDAQGRIAVKLLTPGGDSLWFLPEYVR